MWVVRPKLGPREENSLGVLDFATPPTETQEGRETVAIRLPAFISPTSVADQRPLANCGSDATADAPNTRHEAITQSAMR
jgi:hypothetical protein